MKKIAAILLVGTIGLGVAGCQVNKTKEGKMPEVKVKTTDGQLPAYNVQGPDVEVGSKNDTVKVPTVKVTTPAHKG
jgi:hypothetical protein